MRNNLEQLILAMYEKDIIKFGKFTLKSGKESFVYVDLRTTISYPEIYRDICDILSDYIQQQQLQFDRLLGIPYSALTFASSIAYKDNIPMLLKRKEAKAYGTKKLLEGEYHKDDICLLIEDVVTTGGSSIESLEVLAEHNIKVTDLVCLVDRQGSAQANLQNKHCTLHAMITLTHILDVLHKHEKIDDEQYHRAIAVIED
ncbi:MAG: orotate phosphoribosyltransferase [Gammaproteobacteria bacterium]|nr:orotate phosphoribosyltransferase [Gammaproteobacteria bacterium]